MKSVKLTDICSPKQWKTLSLNQLGQGKYPVYGANGKIGVYTEYNHQDPVLLIGCRGSCGSILITEPYSYANGNAMALDELDNSVDMKWLSYYLMDRGFNDIVTGTSQPQITGQGLQKIVIDLPDKPKQVEIVRILDRVDLLRQMRKQSLQLLDDFLYSTFLEMFGDPEINPKWKMINFGDVIDVLTDYHANGSYETLRKHVKLLSKEDYALMVRTTDLENNDFTKGTRYITKDAYEFLEKSKVFGGEIIINKIGSAGNVYLMPNLNRPVSLGMNAFLLRFDPQVNSIFIYYLLKSSYGEKVISRKIKGAVTKTIRKDAIRSLRLPLPPLDLQKKFAYTVERISNTKKKMQQSMLEMDNQFNALTQRYF